MSEACNCIRDVNSLLGKYNTRLVLAYVGPPGAMLATEKVEPKARGKKKEMFASFCPFCGVKYPNYTSPFQHEEGERKPPFGAQWIPGASS